MNTKFTITATIVGSILTTGVATASPLQGLSVDHLGNMGNGETYRLYVDLDDGARVDAVYGNSTSMLMIAALQGSFYQNMFGGNTSLAINPALFPALPSTEWDSYITIGAIDQTGNPFSANALLDIGMDYTAFGGGGALMTSNGSWFVTPDDEQGGELDGRVLIGQFTVAGGSGDGLQDLLVSVNLQGKDADGVTWSEFGVELPVPAPGAFALLGAAGFCARRRRK